MVQQVKRFPMQAGFIIGLVSIVVMGCVAAPKATIPDHKPNEPVSSSNTTSRCSNCLTVDLASNGRQVLGSVPVESAMDRFEMIDPQGRIISYVAFTDTDIGALIFVDQKLYGTLSHHDAQAFYSCRGYASTPPNHWANEAAAWAASLLAHSKPATEVKLEFSGKSTVRSIMEVAESPFLKKLKSLFSMGSNPFSILSSLNTVRGDIEMNDQFDKAHKGLSVISPGMNESRLVEVMRPEDVSFNSGGMVMAYTSHLVEYFVTNGIVEVIQQPSFYYLSRTRATLFYAPNTQWSLCTPLHWMKALPETP